ncbi:MAG: GspH/FimT family pseudopilin [Rubrivivax sp.]
MPRSAPGNSASRLAPWRAAARGFTLIELMVVLALVAVATGVVALALRDGEATRLEHEAERLAALLESARAEARAAGVPVGWVLTPESRDGAFRFVGLPASRRLPQQWLDAEVSARIADDRPALVLGPEPLLEAQRVRLSLGERTLDVATDGLGPFAVVSAPAASP